MQRTGLPLYAGALLGALVFLDAGIVSAVEMECAEFTEDGKVKVEQKTVGSDVSGMQTQTFGVNAKDGIAGAKEIAQKSSATSESIEIKDGKMNIISICGEKGKIGTVTVCIDTPSGKKCGIKIPKDQGALIDATLGAAASDNPSSAMQKLALGDNASLASKIKTLDPGLLAGMRISSTDLIRMGVPQEYVGQVKDSINENPEQARNLLAAIAGGETGKIKNVLDSTGLGYVADTSAIARNAVRMYADPAKLASAFSDEAQGELYDSKYFCGFGSACPTQDAPFTQRSPAAGFGDERAITPPPVAEPTRILVSPNGRVDPITLYKRALEEIEKAGLEGYTDPRLQRYGLVPTGSKEELATLYLLMAKQESNLNVNASNPSECSYGLYQYCPGQYGLGGMDDVRNPESALKALIRTTQQGKLFQYFGPLQRLGVTNEITKHADWFNTQVAPYANGSITYAPTGSPYVPSGYVGSAFGGPYSSPGSTFGGSPFSGFGNPFGGSSFGTSYGNTGGLLSNLLNFFGFSNPATPIAPAVVVLPSVQTPPAVPSLKLISYPNEAKRGASLVLIWSSAGVAPQPACTLYEIEGINSIPRASKNFGTYTKEIQANYAKSSLVFILECTPADSRVAKPEATTRLEIRVK